MRHYPVNATWKSAGRTRRARGVLACALVAFLLGPADAWSDQRTPPIERRPSRAEPYSDRGQRGRSGPLQPTGMAHCGDLAHAGHQNSASEAADEHLAAFCAMFPAAEATHAAVASGAWSSPATWRDGRLPGEDARVFIPKGMAVTVDREIAAPLFWVRVEGVLRFRPDANTSLTVDSVKIEEDGRLEMGTNERPVGPDSTAAIVIKARGGQPIDHTWDPFELSRGILAHGLVEIRGAAKTPFVPVSNVPTAGATSIQLDTAPVGWRAGDVLVLTATEYDQDETFRLVRVEGSTVTLDRPVRHQRELPAVADAPGFIKPTLHLGNFTRNVEIRSAPEHAGAPGLQGHIMLMHRGGHRVGWVGLHDLGRTTTRPVTDPMMLDGRRDAGIDGRAEATAENVRGRYSLHFHRGGPTGDLSTVEGCAISVKRGGGFKVGLGSHSSKVAVGGCVSHNIDGSHFFTEEGDEIGSFTGNLAIHSVGSRADRDEQGRVTGQRLNPELPGRRLDVGHRGTGFWLNGGGVDVVDNVAAGQAHSGFHVWSRPLNFRITNTYEVRFPSEGLRDRSWAGSMDLVLIEIVPIKFTGNTAYVLGGGKYQGEGGFLFEYHGFAARTRFPDIPYSQMHDLLTWNTSGIKTTYAGNMHFKNVRIIGQFGRTQDLGARLGTQGGNHNLIENLRVEGFARGVAMSRQSVIRGGFFATRIGIQVGGGQETTIDLADMRFGTVPAGTASGADSRGRVPMAGNLQYDLYAQPIFAGRDFNPAMAFAAQPPTYVRGLPDLPKDAELYSIEQMPDYVLPDFGIPGLLDGKTTTREAWEKYRLAPGGAMAPAGAVPLPGFRTNLVVGPSVERDQSNVRGARGGTQGRATTRPDRASGSTTGRAVRGSSDRPERERADAQVEPRRPRPPQERSAGRERDTSSRSQQSTRETRQDPGGDPASATPSGWELVPQSGGRATLVASGRPPRLPLADAGPDQRVSFRDGAALSGIAEPGATVRWSRAYGPGTVSFANPDRAQTKATFSSPGTYVLHLTVEGPAGRTSTAPVLVIVEP